MYDWLKTALDSTNIREWREVSKHYSGDPNVASGYTAIARSILGALENHLRLGGVRYGQRIVKLPDGTVIRVIHNSGLNTVEILVNSEGVAGSTRLVFIYIENGLLHIKQLSKQPEVSDKRNYFEYEIGSYLQEYLTGTGTPINPNNPKVRFYLQGKIGYAPFGNLVSNNNQKNSFHDMVGNLFQSYWYDLYRLEAVASQRAEQINSFLNMLQTEQKEAISYLTPIVTIASNYTGLLRLAIQTWLGVGRSPGQTVYITVTGDVIPMSCTEYVCPFNSVKPFNDGLIYDENYNFWWVRIDGELIVFRKMSPLKDMSLLKKTLKTISNKEDKRKFIMLLLTWLAVDTDTDPVSYSIPVLNDTTGGGREPLYYGWHFNYAAPWEASIVTVRTYPGATNQHWFLQSTLTTIKFSFDTEGFPSLPLVTTPTQDKHFQPCPRAIYYPSFGSFCAIAHSVGWGRVDMEIGDSAPFYCFYNQKNELEVINYFFDDTTEDIYVPDKGWQVCGIGGPLEIQQTTTGHIVRVGGFFSSTGNVDISRDNYSQSETRTDEVQIVHLTQVTTNATNTIDPHSDQCGGADFYSNIPANHEYYSPAGSITTYYAAPELYRTRADVITDTYKVFCVVPVYDAEACAFGRPIEISTTPLLNYHTWPIESWVGSWHVWEYSSIMVRDLGNISAGFRSININYTAHSVTNSGWWYGGNMHTAFLDLPPPSVERDGTVVFLTSRGVFDSNAPYDGGEEWMRCSAIDFLDPCGGSCAALAMLADTSGGMYTDWTKPSAYKILGGYSSDQLIQSGSIRNLRWMGDA